jgi:hypothetical protein
MVLVKREIALYIEATISPRPRMSTHLSRTYLACSFEHFLRIVHDSHGTEFRKHNQIHPGQSHLGSHDDVADLLGVVHDLFVRVQPWHWVLEDADTHCVYMRKIDAKQAVSASRSFANKGHNPIEEARTGVAYIPGELEMSPWRDMLRIVDDCPCEDRKG